MQAPSPGTCQSASYISRSETRHDAVICEKAMPSPIPSASECVSNAFIISFSTLSSSNPSSSDEHSSAYPPPSFFLALLPLSIKEKGECWETPMSPFTAIFRTEKKNARTEVEKVCRMQTLHEPTQTRFYVRSCCDSMLYTRGEEGIVSVGNRWATLCFVLFGWGTGRMSQPRAL